MDLKTFNNLSDEEIIAMSKKDVGNFKFLYERYKQKLEIYAIKISGFSQEEAEDIVQNSFIKIWGNLNNIDTSTKVSSFIYNVVHNETISEWRRKKKKLDPIEIKNDSDLYIQSNENDLSAEKNQKISKILNLLSPNYREILILRYLENMDYEEISDILKIPMGTVAARVKRAKDQFEKYSDKHDFF